MPENFLSIRRLTGALANTEFCPGIPVEEGGKWPKPKNCPQKNRQEKTGEFFNQEWETCRQCWEDWSSRGSKWQTIK